MDFVPAACTFADDDDADNDDDDDSYNYYWNQNAADHGCCVCGDIGTMNGASCRDE